MKRKIFRVLFTLVLVLSFSLVTAVPAMAGNPTIVLTTPGGGIDSLTGTPTGSGTEAGVHSIVITDATASTLTGTDAESNTAANTIATTLAGTEVLTVTIAGGAITTAALAAATADVALLTAVATDIQTKINAATTAPDVDVTVSVAGTSNAKYFVITVDEAGVSNSITTQVTGTGAAPTGLSGVDPVAGIDAKAVDTFTAATGSNGLWVAANGGTTKTITHTTAAGTASDLAGLKALVIPADAFIGGITLAASGVLSAGTAIVTVTAGTASLLAIATQPAGSVSGVALTTQPVVEARDDSGNVDLTYVTDVVASEDDLGTLTGTTTQTPLAGVATFTDLVYTATADGEVFQIDFTSTGITGVTSNNVTCGVVATKLVFTTQPAGSVSGAALTTQPVVLAQDQFGTTDTTYVANVVAATDDLGTLTGTTTKAAVAGVATFTDLTYTATADGEIFQIDVTSGALTGATSNDVTSDVTIGPTGGGAPPPAPAPTTVEATLFGTTESFSISSEGEVLETFTATSVDGTLTTTIPAGTIALDENGAPLATLTADINPSPPSLPEGSSIIGSAYEFGPPGATLAPAITLEYTYDPAEIPEGVAEGDLVLAYYDEAAGAWVELPSTVDPVTHTITALVSHFTTFAVIAPTAPPLPAPAAFVTSDLSITPAEVEPNEAVTISVSVANTSGMEGSYTVVLMINGVTEAEESVTIAAGDSQSASFSVSREDTGSYSIAIDDLSGTFVVTGATPPPAPTAVNWGLIGGIIAGVIIVGIITWRVVSSRRS